VRRARAGEGACWRGRVREKARAEEGACRRRRCVCSRAWSRQRTRAASTARSEQQVEVIE
jgi:hypothetical protein